MPRNNNKKKDYNKPNFWGMIQNVLIASMNKGQLFGCAIAIIVIIMALKLPMKDSKELFEEIIALFGNLYYIGWILGVFSTAGWFYNTKRLRKLHTKEIERISNEKKTLQTQLMNKKLRSSN